MVQKFGGALIRAERARAALVIAGARTIRRPRRCLPAICAIPNWRPEDRYTGHGASLLASHFAEGPESRPRLAMFGSQDYRIVIQTIMAGLPSLVLVLPQITSMAI